MWVRYRYFYTIRTGWKFTYRNNSFFCHCKRDYQGSTNKYDWLHEHHFNSWYLDAFGWNSNLWDLFGGMKKLSSSKCLRLNLHIQYDIYCALHILFRADMFVSGKHFHQHIYNNGLFFVCRSIYPPIRHRWGLWISKWYSSRKYGSFRCHIYIMGTCPCCRCVFHLHLLDR